MAMGTRPTPALQRTRVGAHALKQKGVTWGSSTNRTKALIGDTVVIKDVKTPKIPAAIRSHSTCGSAVVQDMKDVCQGYSSTLFYHLLCICSQEIWVKSIMFTVIKDGDG